MSSEWRSGKLGDFIELKRGYDLAQAKRIPGPYPLVSSAGVSDCHSVPMAKGPGVVTGRYGTIGQVYFVEQDFWPLNTTLYVRDFKGNDPKFINYFLKTVDFLAYSDKAAVPGLNRNHLHEALAQIPDLVTQLNIAKVLGALDDRITLLRETNITLEAIAQALFKSWFVDFDPVRAKMEGRAAEGMDEATAALFPDGFEEAELGLVPRGWGYVAIRDVVEGVFDGPHATPPEADAGPVFLGIKNLTGTALNLGEIRHIAEAQWQQWTRRVEPQGGDIVFSYEATLGFFALIPKNLRCCLGRRLALIRPKVIGGAGHFWFHQFVATPFQRLLEKHTIQGATVNRIALKEFPSYGVLNPPLRLQVEFDKVVAPLWLKIHENQAQAQTLATLRDTLLPRLISGQLRLPEAELQIQEAAT
jgi:type I restriction enzyme, S subunit